MRKRPATKHAGKARHAAAMKAKAKAKAAKAKAKTAAKHAAKAAAKPKAKAKAAATAAAKADDDGAPDVDGAIKRFWNRFQRPGAVAPSWRRGSEAASSTPTTPLASSRRAQEVNVSRNPIRYM